MHANVSCRRCKTAKSPENFASFCLKNAKRDSQMATSCLTVGPLLFLFHLNVPHNRDVSKTNAHIPGMPKSVATVFYGLVLEVGEGFTITTGVHDVC